ncbi:hypothetical protein HHK36_030857 [Tetracentron sinense]|uniref:Uncharacterized protein n=1 Tax=Tetracentron sinense TaxID=13715 RepID=A0A834YA16_TETSI|nr:hypothetical protein HHK36_030857 [Tetracentron sinense]
MFLSSSQQPSFFLSLLRLFSQSVSSSAVLTERLKRKIAALSIDGEEEIQSHTPPLQPAALPLPNGRTMSQPAVKQHDEIIKVQKENKTRVVREGKERRRQWAQRITPRPSGGDKGVQDALETESLQNATDNQGMLREGKERRRQWAQRIAPRPSGGDKGVQDALETESLQNATDNRGMLPSDIVNLLAAREKQVFLSDTEEEDVAATPNPRKKRLKSSGPETVILNDIPPAQCLHNSLEFLKKKKMQVSRSSSVLNNSKQALRLLSRYGLVSKK